MAGCYYYQAPELFLPLLFLLSHLLLEEFVGFWFSGVCLFEYLFIYFLNMFSICNPDLLAILLPVSQVLG